MKRGADKVEERVRAVTFAVTAMHVTIDEVAAHFNEEYGALAKKLTRSEERRATAQDSLEKCQKDNAVQAKENKSLSARIAVLETEIEGARAPNAKLSGVDAGDGKKSAAEEKKANKEKKGTRMRSSKPVAERRGKLKRKGTPYRARRQSALASDLTGNKVVKMSPMNTPITSATSLAGVLLAAAATEQEAQRIAAEQQAADVAADVATEQEAQRAAAEQQAADKAAAASAGDASVAAAAGASSGAAITSATSGKIQASGRKQKKAKKRSPSNPQYTPRPLSNAGFVGEKNDKWLKDALHD
jgi:dTMP kinase